LPFTGIGGILGINGNFAGLAAASAMSAPLQVTGVAPLEPFGAASVVFATGLSLAALRSLAMADARQGVALDPSGLCAEASGYDYWSALQGDWMGLGGYIRDVGQYWADVATAPLDYYRTFREAGLGRFWATVQAANMTVGKVVGYSSVRKNWGAFCKH
jgi:hypothetical protein